MKLELRRVTVQSPRAGNARQSWPERQSLLMRVSDAQGHAGVGEASPLPGYSPEQLDDVEQALSQLQPLALERALAESPIAAVLAAACSLVPPALPSARMALETAALDYVGQRERVAAPVLLGAAAGSERALAELAGSPLDADFYARCEHAVHTGFRHLKVKLGVPGQLDAELSALTATAARFGRAVSWRADANRSLSLDDVERAASALAALDLELFEEPGALPGSAPPPFALALDESLQRLDVGAACERLQATSARFAVLKPTVLGGLTHCRELAERAQRLGVQAIVSHCFDGPVAFRAAAALALALPPGAAHGLAPHAALAGWPQPEAPVVHGCVRAWSEPGLGLRAGSAFE